MTLDEIIQKINASVENKVETPKDETYVRGVTPLYKSEYAFEDGLLDALGSHIGGLAPRGIQDAIQRLVAEVDGPRLRYANQALSHNAAFTDAMKRLSEWRIANAPEPK